MSKFTKGPWALDRFGSLRTAEGGDVILRGVTTLCSGTEERMIEAESNMRLIAAAPELLEALECAVDLAWVDDSHVVQFDSSVMFGPYYDFDGLDGSRRIEFYGEYSCIVWPGSKWSAYCTYEGSMWFEKFDTAAQAKEACMLLLDKVLPDHPAMRARAAIAKARGES